MQEIPRDFWRVPNYNQNKKKRRPIKTLKDHVLKEKSEENFCRKAPKTRKKDMVGSSRNHSKRAPASKSSEGDY